MADKEPDLIHQYRFRVRTGDGREVVSDIATVKHPSLTSGLDEPAAKVVWAEVPVTRILVAVRGKQQGDFSPDAGFKDLAGTVVQHQFSTEELSFAVRSPRDAQSGLPSGRRA